MVPFGPLGLVFTHIDASGVIEPRPLQSVQALKSCIGFKRYPHGSDTESGHNKQEDVDYSEVEEHAVCLHFSHHSTIGFIHEQVLT